MKAFARKSLAMAMTLLMVLSVCVLPAYADNIPVTGVTLDASSATLNLTGEKLLTATVAPSNATTTTVTWSSSDPAVATVVENNGLVKAVSVGTTTITATTTDGGFAASCEVTVQKIPFGAATVVDAMTFSVNTSIDTVLSKLPSKVTVKLNNTNGGSATKEFNVGKSSDTTAPFYWSCDDYNSDVKGSYTFKAVRSANADTILANYAASGESITCTVTVGDYTTLPTLNISALMDETDTVDGIDVYVAEWVKDAYGTSATGATFTYSGLDYGDIDSSDDYELDSDVYDEDYSWPLTDSFTATMKTSGGVTYRVPVELKMYVSDCTKTFDVSGDDLSSVVTYLDTILGVKYPGEDLETIEFYDLDLSGGTLYVDSNRDEEVEEDTYTASDLSDMVYQPNGSGEYSVIEYVAYYDYEDEEDDYIEGRIYLAADSYMLINIEVTEDDIVEFSASDFEELYLSLDDDYDELTYVTFPTINSKTSGYLYYDFDESDGKGDLVKTAKCYMEPDDKQIDLDDLVYVPGPNMKSGTNSYKFTAVGYEGKSKRTEYGYLVITFVETADITIEAGKGEEVEIDPDVFLDFLKDELNTTKTIEIISVTISDAPRSKNTGYLVTDGEELTKSGDKTFYADEDDVDVDKKKYDLDDLSYLGGNKASTTHATFSIKYKLNKSTKTKSDCTIDFIVGSTHSLQGTTKASEVMKFSGSVDAFVDLGDNDNKYIQFTSLPTLGKLYYNYGTSTQEDVKIGTEYYLTSASGKKLLKNITYVPSYNNSKIAKADSISVKGYNAKDKAITGTINITVTYAQSSAYFTDVYNSTYADSIDFLKNQNITTGMTATTFGTNDKVTRGQFVTFLYRAAGQPSVSTTNTFTDVKSTDYYYNAIRWAVKEGITTGRSATIFDPNANVTYQEIMTFLYRYDVTYLGHSASLGSSSYVYDYSKVDTWAQNPVKWAVQKGVLTSGYLYPTTAGTRADVALYLHRMLTL